METEGQGLLGGEAIFAYLNKYYAPEVDPFN